MKVSELFEGPYHIDSDYRPHIKMDSYPSMDGLKRENEFLGTLDKDGKEYNFWLSHSKKVAKISTNGKDEIGQIRQLIVAELRFDNRAKLPIKNELQVDTAYTHPDYRGKFLSGGLYILLSRYGYSVVSDFTQYNGGKELWKKLAKESDARKFVVRVWDDETSDWINDADGNPLKFDADNLDDDKVWKDISQHNEATTLLVLQSK